MYEYQARRNEKSRWPDAVYDGDTIELIIDCGFDQYTRQKIRVLGVNTPEIRSHQKYAAIIAKQETLTWLKVGETPIERWPLVIRTKEKDNFGRWLAEVYRKTDGESLTDYLLSRGYKPYGG
jgi:micrococcal nuclease